MKDNDIAIDVGVLGEGSRKLGRQMSEIEALAAQLRSNIAVVGREVDTSNYRHVEKIVTDVVYKLRAATERLQNGRRFLDNLDDKAEKYLGCRYSG